MDFHQIWGSVFPWRSAWMLLAMMLFCAPNFTVAQPDLPCSLSTGTSRESFTASELLPTGSVVGVLNIIGDASENGTIQLSLSQDDAAVEIIPGTKNISLKRLLDREGIDGPSEVNLVVYCRKKDSTESVFSIPLRVFVSDANDNSPEFVYFPPFIEISEITPAGTVVTSRPITAVDKDQTGPYSTVQYSVDEGSYSEHFTFANPLKGILSLLKPLDFEEVQQFNITVKAQDLGDPPATSTVVIPVRVKDADDLNPKFDDERYTSVIPDEAPVGSVLDVEPRSIKARDMDKDINASLRYSFNSDKMDGMYFSIDDSTGVVTLRRPIEDDVVFPLTLVIRASQIDNNERSALTTLSVIRNSSIGLRFTRTNFEVNVPENLPTNQTVITLTTNRPNNKNLQFQIANRSSEYFQITEMGELVLVEPLDYDVDKWIVVVVNVSDGELSDCTRVNVNVIDANKHSPLFKSQLYNFVVTDTTLRAGSVLGQVQVTDGDSNDDISLSLAGNMAKNFVIDNEGLIRVANSSVLNSTLTHLMVIATDTGFPPRQSTVPVIVSIADQMALSSSIFNADSSYLLMIIFGAVLGILIVVILILALYIAKQRSHSPLTAYVGGRSGLLHEKLLRGSSPLSNGRSRSHAVGMENPVFRQEIPATPPASCRSDLSQANRSMASTALMKNESRLSSLIAVGLKENHIENQNENEEKYSPSTSSVRETNSSSSSEKTMDKSIPRRVKKLSWEDEKRKKTELDPCVSVTPLTSHDNNACYF